MRSPVLAAALLLALTGCTTDGAGEAASGAAPPVVAPADGGEENGPAGLAVELVATGLSAPVWATSPPGDSRLFVVEQTGTIRQILDGRPADTPYLDVTRFVTTEGLEQGLLGMAFHPDFADNRRVFVSFTNVGGHTRVLEYREDPRDVSRLDPGSGRRIYAIDQPHQYHNGGMIRFGPDGMLWLGLGDGGGTGDRYGNGQNPHTPLGAIIRIDVDIRRPYGIPDDNPFADGPSADGRSGAPEVFAYGFRNPWRFSFAGDSLLYVADVGQETAEEINVIDIATDAGGNYGWSVLEGLECFRAEPCDGTGLVPPDLVVPHVRSCAIIGGAVYEGADIPGLRGHYLYADYCVGWVRSIRWDGVGFRDETDWSDHLGDLGQITSLAEDGDGEPLILTSGGEIHRIVALR